MPRWLGFLGPWGAPPDAPAWGAVACAVVAVGIACASRATREAFATRVSSRVFVGTCAFAAALASLGYVAFYLRGGPRIIDATTYFLQGRALSEGHFAWRVPEPTASFRGRFLVFHDDAHRGATVAGIFPPGYPLLLSLGFAFGAPMAVGPALAAAIVMATFALARELACGAGMDRASAESVARLAAVLSVACAALRYHTADTMAHGACALAFSCALVAALRARRMPREGDREEGSPWMFLMGGLALGFVVATRFASAIALGAVLAWLASGHAARGKALVACFVGALPGVALLLVAQYASTGAAFGSAQRAYYAASDGPAGCFRYGFGAGIGCLFEHGDFVRARLANGDSTFYGPLAALGTTARRLGHHFADVANLGPLALLAFAALVSSPRGSRRPLGVRASFALVAALVLAYAPFYFDGDYPGGGARFFADALPIEHALVALGAARVAFSLRVPIARVGALVVALSALGFALHMAYAHESLRARDGGRPMFEPDLLAHAHLVPSSRDHASTLPALPALVFLETDHGFDLAHDPDAIEHAARGEASEKGAPYVARARGDDHDRLVYERLGRPSSWIYRFQAPTAKTVGDLATSPKAPDESEGLLEPWLPQPSWGHGAEAWRFESENEWPPLAQSGGAWAEPTWTNASSGEACASPAGAGRVLTIHAGAGSDGTVTVALPIPRKGRWRATPRILVSGSGEPPAGSIYLFDPARHELLLEWSLAAGSTPPPCVDLLPRAFDSPDGAELEMTLQLRGPEHGAERATLGLDRVLLTPEPPR